MINPFKVTLVLIIIISLVKPFHLKSQSISDTLLISRHKDFQTSIEKLRSTNAYNITKSAIPLFAASALATTVDKRLKETRDFHLYDFRFKADDYLLYAPMAVKYE